MKAVPKGKPGKEVQASKAGSLLKSTDSMPGVDKDEIKSPTSRSLAKSDSLFAQSAV